MNTLEEALARCLDRFSLVGGAEFNQNLGRDYPIGVVLAPIRASVGERAKGWRAVLGQWRGDGPNAATAVANLFLELGKACEAMRGYHASGIANIEREMGLVHAPPQNDLTSMVTEASNGQEIEISPKQLSALQGLLSAWAKVPPIPPRPPTE